MAISWGSWTRSINGQRFRLGVDASVSGTRITAKYYIQANAPVNDNQKLTMSGAISGYASFKLSSTSTKFITSRTKTGYRGKTYTLSGKVTGIYNGLSPSFTHKVKIPAAKPSKPGRPSISAPSSSSIKGSLRTAPSNGGAGISRYEWNLSTSGSTHSSGKTKSKTISGLSANTSYRVRVRAVNSAGAGPWSEYSNAVKTKPQKPNSPSNVRVSRASDKQMTVTWSASATTARPITSCKIIRRDNIRGSYATIATVSGSKRTYTDKSTVANRRYDYIVETVNSGGSSRASSYAGINTTPAAPDAPRVTRVGEKINLTLAAKSSWTKQVTQYIIQDNPGGKGWTTVATISKATTWTHQEPDLQVAHQYRVAARTSSNVLTSSYSASSIKVQLLAPPAAPTNLSPSGLVGAAVDEQSELWYNLSFTHNPVDASDTTYYKVRYREAGNGSSWTETPKYIKSGIEAGGTVTYKLPAEYVSLGTQIEWQASTWGAHASQGAWSESAVFIPSDPPTAYLDIEEVWEFSEFTVEWGYYDYEGTEQSRAEAYLENSDGDVIETVFVNGPDKQATFTEKVQNGEEYTVSVVVYDGHNIASDPESASFTVAYRLPVKPLLTAEWDRESGATILDVQNDVITDNSDLHSYWDGEPDGLSSSTLERDGVLISRNYARWRNDFRGISDGSAFIDPEFVPVPLEHSSGLSQCVKATDQQPGPGSASMAFGYWTQEAGWNILISALTFDSGVSVIYENGDWSDGRVTEEIGELIPGEWTDIRIEDIQLQGTQFFFQKEDTEVINVYVTAPLVTNIETNPSGWFEYFDGDTYPLINNVETVGNDIQRRVDDGEWETVLQGLPTDMTTADFTTPLGHEVEYRAVAVSELPSSNFSEARSIYAGIGNADAYLGGGPGFAQTVRLRRNPQTQGQIGLAGKVLHSFAGRTMPVGFDGPMTTRELTWTGSLLTEEQSLSEFEDIAVLPGQHLLRTPDALGIAGQLDVLSYTRGTAGAIWDVSVKVTETAGAN